VKGRAARSGERIGECRQRRRELAGGEGVEAAKAGPSFETAVPEEMRIDDAVRDGQAQPGNEKVFELFPEEFSVRFFSFHG